MDEKIIKASVISAGAGGGPKVVKQEVYSATIEAREIVDAARSEAQKIREEAQCEREAIEQAAREKGRSESVAQWYGILATARANADKLGEQHEQDLVRLALRVAEKIIGEQLRSDPSTIVSIVREALKSVRRDRNLTIQVNPQYTDELRRRLDQLKTSVGVSVEIQVVANHAVAPGGCVVESELGVIDAQLETQLRCLEEILLRAKT
jgi:type III secretion protein L